MRGVVRRGHGGVPQPSWRALLPIGALVLSCLVVGCGGTSNAGSGASKAADAVAGDSSYVTGEDAYDHEEDAPSSVETQATTNGSSDGASSAQDGDEKVIIRSAVVSLRSRDYDTVLSAVRTIISDAHGEVIDSSEHGGSARTITIEARVDPSALEGAVEALRTIEGAQVISANVSASDVTRTYDDTERRIDILNEQYEHYRKMLDEATTVEDMLTISDRMYELMAEIKTYTDRRDDLRHDADRSQLTVSLTEVEALGDDTTAGMGSIAQDAFADSWGAFTSVVTRLVVLLIMALPYLVIVAVVLIVVRQWRRSHPGARRGRGAGADNTDDDTMTTTARAGQPQASHAPSGSGIPTPPGQDGNQDERS